MKIYRLSGRYFLLIAMLSFFTLLSACGKTGSLYLPNDSLEPQAAPQSDTESQNTQSKE